MDSTHHHPRHEHHDVHQQRLLWFFSFCNQRSSSSSSSSGSSIRRGTTSSRRKAATNRNKFALQYQQQLQQQQRQSSIVFGRDLTEHARSYSDEDSIPHIVRSCTRFIEKNGIIFGIYRLSGMRVNINKLRQDFDRNPKMTQIEGEPISNDAHAVACVLKQYFRELPTPLLTFHMYERFIELFKHASNRNSLVSNNDENTDTRNENDDTDIIDIESGTDRDRCAYHSIESKINNDSIIESDRSRPNKTKANQRLINPVAMSRCRLTSQQSSPIVASQPTRNTNFTSSVSDSQLISLSSVVTTTTTDVKYQVKLEDLRQLLLQLPKAHYQTLKFLMRHLAFIAANGEKTGMDSKNVAIVWAPNLLKPRELELSAGLETLQVIGLQAVITEQLIKHHKFLFDNVDHISTTTTVVVGVGRASEIEDKNEAQSKSIVTEENEYCDGEMSTEKQEQSAMQSKTPEPTVSAGLGKSQTTTNIDSEVQIDNTIGALGPD